MATLDELLQQALEQGGQSVLFESGRRPRVRASDRMFDLDSPPVDDETIWQIGRELLPAGERMPHSPMGLWIPRNYRTASGKEFVVSHFRHGTRTSLSFTLVSVALPAIRPAGPRTSSGLYCRWCGMESDTSDHCSWCHRDLRQVPGVGGHPQTEPETHPGERPGDAAVPAMLAGVVPPRAGHDAKPLPRDADDIEPPREP